MSPTECVNCGWDVLDTEACPNSPDTCIECCPCHSERAAEYAESEAGERAGDAARDGDH